MNTKTIPQPLRGRLKRARRKYIRLGSRCTLKRGPSHRRAFKARLRYDRVYNLEAQLTGAELISGMTLRPHSWAQHEDSSKLQTPPLVQR